jgi:type IV pilus assembly protein PilM
MIEAHMEAMKGGRLQPVHVDVEPLALARSLLAGNPSYMAQTVMVLDLGATFSGIYIFRQGWPSFLRTIPTGGEALTDAVREQLGLSVQEAEAAKRLYGDLTNMAFEPPSAAPEPSADFESTYDAVPPSTAEPAEPPRPAAPRMAGQATKSEPVWPQDELTPAMQEAQGYVSSALANKLYDLVNEINRSLDYYRRQNRNENIAAILLSGGSAVIPGLPEMITAEAGVPAVVADPFQYLETAGVAPSEYLRDIGPTMAVSVGLALRDMIE